MTDSHALQVLLDLVSRGKYDVSEDLVRACYEVERQFQFDRDRDVPMDRIRRIVEAEAVRQMGGSAAEGDPR